MTGSATVQAGQFADRLFGRYQNGFVAAAYGINGQATPAGGYTFKGRLRSKFFEWPRERESLLKWARDCRDRYDIYLVPNLRTARNRKVEFGKEGRYVWADIDHVTDDTRRRLDAVLSKGSLLVQSGGRGGLHVYIRLDGWYPRRVFQDLNRQFDTYIGGDHKFRDNTLLRLPGTWNHKGRAKGLDSYPVILSDDEYETTPWSPSALTQAFGLLPQLTPPQSKPKKAKPKKGRASHRPRRQAQQIDPVEAEPPPADLPDEIRRLVPFNTKKTARTDRSRSGQLYGLVAAAMSYGYSDGQIMGIARLSEPAQEKWPSPRDLHRQIQICINKLRPGHCHVGLTCHDAGCSTGGGRVAEEIVAISHHFRSEYRPRRTLPADTKIMDALLRRARLIGDLKLDLSERELSDLAGVSRVTAEKGLKRLITAGYLRHLVNANGNPIRAGHGPLVSRSFRYELVCKSVVPMPHTHTVSFFGFLGDNEIDTRLSPNHDVWRYRALMAEKRTYEALLRGLATVKR